MDLKEVLNKWHSSSNEPWATSHVKEDTRILDVDVLALSVCLFRIYGYDDPERFNPFEYFSQSIKDKILQEDHDKANDIADYYGKRYLAQQLKTGTVTEYQKKLLGILNGNRRVFTNKQIGMIYRIPEFYDSDTKFDKLCDSNNFEKKVKVEMPRGVLDLELKFLDSIRVRQRGYGDCTNYWFKNIKTGDPFKISVDSKNVLKSIWDQHIQSLEVVSLQGMAYKNISFNETQFYNLSKWSVTSRILK